MTVINTISGPVEINTSRQYSEADLAAFQQVEPLLRNAGMDVDHEFAVANAKPITDYFENNRNTAISVQSIIDFVNANPTLFKFRTPAQRRFDTVVATEGVERGQQVVDYLAGQRSLVNSGDQLFENAAELMQELHGRPITPESVHAAIGRISAPTSRFDTRRRGQLHFAHGPARKLSQAAQQDDPNRKFGQMFSRSEINKTPQDYLRERNQAAEPTQPTPEMQLSKEEATWRQLTLGHRNFGTHGQQNQIRVLIEQERAQGKSWRQTHDSVERLVNVFKRSKMVG